MHFFRRAGAVLCLALLALLSLLPGGGIEPVRGGYYAIGFSAEHVVAYAGTMVMLVLAWGPRFGLGRLGAALAAYGTLLEAAQLVVPGRSAQLGDAIENVIGVIAGVAVFAAYLAVRRPTAKAAPAD